MKNAHATMPHRLSIPAIVALFVCGPLLGSAVGAATNSINGAISPQYFVDVIGARGDIAQLSVKSGITRGAILGLAYGSLFVVLLLIACRMRCEFTVAMQYVALAVFIALLLWCIGGTIAVIYVSQVGSGANPTWFGFHTSSSSRLSYAWVRGSIFALENFGFLAILLSIAWYGYRNLRPAVAEKK